MPCKITFVINGSKVGIKTEWKSIKEKEINYLCSLINGLQVGHFESEILESISSFGKTSNEQVTSKKILNRIMGRSEFLNKAMVPAEQVGEENWGKEII